MAGDQGPWLRRRVHILLRALGGDYLRLGEFVKDRDKYEVASLESLRAQVDDVIETLSEREQQAMRLRFGLTDGRSRTLKEAGQGMRVTAERVEQLEAAALEKLREPTRRGLLPGVLP